MLEMLLFTYKQQFGFDFPLTEHEEKTEIQLINLIYTCLQQNDPNARCDPSVNLFPDAPGQ